MQSFNYVRHNQPEKLIDFLVRRFPYQQKSAWLNNIFRGLVKVDGNTVVPEIVLKRRALVSYERPREEEPEVDKTYQIFYEDNDIVVVEKSGNIPIGESGKYYRNTLLNVLKEEEGYPELFAVHRLDRETSGILCIAKKKEIATIMGMQFAKGEPEKTYHAVLVGEMVDQELFVDQPIGKQKEGLARIRQTVRENGKSSQTLFQRLQTNNGLTLVRVKTFTGRTHQIRCHAEYIGYPILGDKLYGQTDERFLAIMRKIEEPRFNPFGIIDRQLLHASTLTFKHPEKDTRLTFNSEYTTTFSNYSSVKDLLTL